MKLIESIAKRSITKESQCKLSAITKSVRSFESEDLRKLLTFCYKDESGDSVAKLQRRILGTVVNAVFTEEKPVFFISKAILLDLMQKDSNYKNKSLNGEIYGRVWAFLTEELQMFKVIRDGSVSKKATILELVDPELLKIMMEQVSKSYVNSLREKMVEIWEKYEPTSTAKAPNNEDKSAQTTQDFTQDFTPEIESEIETEPEHDPDWMSLENYESSQGKVQEDGINKSSDRPVQAGREKLTLKATPVASQSPSYPPVLNRRYLKLKSDDDSLFESYRDAQFPDFGVVKRPTLE